MTAPFNKPISTDDLERFKAYKLANPTWGIFHVVLEDKNVENKHVDTAAQKAYIAKDREAHHLANVLRGMSKSQRLKLARQVL